jgi:hypothetical protein
MTGKEWGRESVKIKAYARKFTGKKSKHPLWELREAAQRRIMAHKLRLHKHSNKTQGLIYGSSLSHACFHRELCLSLENLHLRTTHLPPTPHSKRMVL